MSVGQLVVFLCCIGQMSSYFGHNFYKRGQYVPRAVVASGTTARGASVTPHPTVTAATTSNATSNMDEDLQALLHNVDDDFITEVAETFNMFR